MAADNIKRIRGDILIASVLVMTGVVLISLSLREIGSAGREPQLAQATQPMQPSSEPQKTAPPAESKPGGDRPTTPAPEPARPDADAQKAGAKPVLPPAPAEKTAPPIKQK
ncbi:hypothetical protein JQ633_27400 [Bradyrhizobium tropiciagri]|uniref:hypothetical protein n=1 Tax=Bradyrhizobium tropiciagri TaxID=312253 RepID=UPI001BA4C682|nr:hypothetical protein [Bradyrhizobium tropiciagri]MBR0874114.1 hypothetical protein [Bradyrhizobium tropiciagri]